MTTPTPSATPPPWWRRVLGPLAVLSLAGSLVTGLVIAPQDAVQGEPQRLMYVHVPAAWSAFLAFGLVLVASIGYLWRRDLRWDRRAQAAAELGVGMTALTLALGSLWGRPIWGVWWAWDPRLVSTAVLLFVYVGYLGARGLSADPHVNARRAAVIGVLGFVEVPVVHFSVLWWRSLHQPPTLLQPGAHPIAPVMLAALVAGVVAFTLLGGWVLCRRVEQLTHGSPTPIVAWRDGENSSPVATPTEPTVPTPSIHVRGGSR